MKDYFIIIATAMVLIFACIASYKMGYASTPTKYIKCENGVFTFEVYPVLGSIFMKIYIRHIGYFPLLSITCDFKMIHYPVTCTSSIPLPHAVRHHASAVAK